MSEAEAAQILARAIEGGACDEDLRIYHARDLTRVPNKLSLLGQDAAARLGALLDRPLRIDLVGGQNERSKPERVVFLALQARYLEIRNGF